MQKLVWITGAFVVVGSAAVAVQGCKQRGASKLRSAEDVANAQDGNNNGGAEGDETPPVLRANGKDYKADSLKLKVAPSNEGGMTTSPTWTPQLTMYGTGGTQWECQLGGQQTGYTLSAMRGPYLSNSAYGLVYYYECWGTRSSFYVAPVAAASVADANAKGAGDDYAFLTSTGEELKKAGGKAFDAVSDSNEGGMTSVVAAGVAAGVPISTNGDGGLVKYATANTPTACPSAGQQLGFVYQQWSGPHPSAVYAGAYTYYCWGYKASAHPYGHVVPG